MKIYKEIISFNRAFLMVRHIISSLKKTKEISKETKQSGNVFLNTLNKDVINFNHEKLKEILSYYQPNVFVDSKIRLKIKNIKNDVIVDFHEKSNVIFNQKSLSINNGYLTMYFNSADMEIINIFLNDNNVSEKIELKNYKNKSFNKSEAVYRKHFFKRLTPNFNAEEQSVLVKWFKKTNI